MTAHALHQLSLTGRADELLARLDHVTPHDGDGLAAVARERGWVEAVKHLAARRLLTPEGAAEAGKLLAATNEWVDEQNDDFDTPGLPPVPGTDEPLPQLADLRPPRAVAEDTPPEPKPHPVPAAPKSRPGKKPPAPEPAPVAALPPLDGVDPARVHDLFRLHPPYKPPPPPDPRPGFATFWDPGLSIAGLRLKSPALLCPAEWGDKQPFGKAYSTEGWRQLRLIGPGKEYDRQAKGLAAAEEPAAARVVVAFLALAYLSTGKWPDIPRVRCREVLSSGRRVVVGAAPGFGIELANVADEWTTPGLAVVAVPPEPRPARRRR